MVISHVFMLMSHVRMLISLFTYANEISLEVRVRELPLRPPPHLTQHVLYMYCTFKKQVVSLQCQVTLWVSGIT